MKRCVAFCVCATMCISPLVGCATMTAGGAATVIGAMAPIVIAVLHNRAAKDEAEDDFRARIADKCKPDLIRAGQAALHLVGEFKLVIDEVQPATPSGRQACWQVAAHRTRDWYIARYRETPFELVVRLYECANAEPPPDAGDDWMFYAEIALRHMGYDDETISALIGSTDGDLTQEELDVLLRLPIQ